MLVVQMFTYMSSKKESDFVVINTRPLKRISEDLDTSPNSLLLNVNTPMQDLIAALKTVEAKIRISKKERR